MSSSSSSSTAATAPSSSSSSSAANDSSSTFSGPKSIYQPSSSRSNYRSSNSSRGGGSVSMSTRGARGNSNAGNLSSSSSSSSSDSNAVEKMVQDIRPEWPQAKIKAICAKYDYDHDRIADVVSASFDQPSELADEDEENAWRKVGKKPGDSAVAGAGSQQTSSASSSSSRGGGGRARGGAPPQGASSRSSGGANGGPFSDRAQQISANEQAMRTMSMSSRGGFASSGATRGSRENSMNANAANSNTMLGTTPGSTFAARLGADTDAIGTTGVTDASKRKAKRSMEKERESKSHAVSVVQLPVAGKSYAASLGLNKAPSTSVAPSNAAPPASAPAVSTHTTPPAAEEAHESKVASSISPLESASNNQTDVPKSGAIEVSSSATIGETLQLSPAKTAVLHAAPAFSEVASRSAVIAEMPVHSEESKTQEVKPSFAAAAASASSVKPGVQKMWRKKEQPVAASAKAAQATAAPAAAASEVAPSTISFIDSSSSSASPQSQSSTSPSTTSLLPFSAASVQAMATPDAHALDSFNNPPDFIKQQLAFLQQFGPAASANTLSHPAPLMSSSSSNPSALSEISTQSLLSSSPVPMASSPSLLTQYDQFAGLFATQPRAAAADLAPAHDAVILPRHLQSVEPAANSIQFGFASSKSSGPRPAQPKASSVAPTHAIAPSSSPSSSSPDASSSLSQIHSDVTPAAFQPSNSSPTRFATSTSPLPQSLLSADAVDTSKHGSGLTRPNPVSLLAAITASALAQNSLDAAASQQQASSQQPVHEHTIPSSASGVLSHPQDYHQLSSSSLSQQQPSSHGYSVQGQHDGGNVAQHQSSSPLGAYGADVSAQHHHSNEQQQQQMAYNSSYLNMAESMSAHGAFDPAMYAVNYGGEPNSNQFASANSAYPMYDINAYSEFAPNSFALQHHQQQQQQQQRGAQQQNKRGGGNYNARNSGGSNNSSPSQSSQQQSGQQSSLSSLPSHYMPYGQAQGQAQQQQQQNRQAGGAPPSNLYQPTTAQNLNSARGGPLNAGALGNKNAPSLIPSPASQLVRPLQSNAQQSQDAYSNPRASPQQSLYGNVPKNMQLPQPPGTSTSPAPQAGSLASMQQQQQPQQPQSSHFSSSSSLNGAYNQAGNTKAGGGGPPSPQSFAKAGAYGNNSNQKPYNKSLQSAAPLTAPSPPQPSPYTAAGAYAPPPGPGGLSPYQPFAGISPYPYPMQGYPMSPYGFAPGGYPQPGAGPPGFVPRATYQPPQFATGSPYAPSASGYAAAQFQDYDPAVAAAAVAAASAHYEANAAETQNFPWQHQQQQGKREEPARYPNYPLPPAQQQQQHHSSQASAQSNAPPLQPQYSYQPSWSPSM